MRVPIKAKLFRRWVSIAYVDELIDDDGKTELFGDCLFDEKKIRINVSMHHDGREVLSTLQHEMRHYSLRGSGLTAILGDRKEEAIVQALECVEADLFVLNPSGPFRWADVEFPWEDPKAE